MAYKATGKLSRFADLYCKLDKDERFKKKVDDIIDNDGNGCHLLRLLRLPTTNVQVSSGLLDALLERYDHEKHYFIINGHNLNITLEDVLYITGLPINGKPVITSKTRVPSAIPKVFTSPLKGKLKVNYLENTALNEKKDDNEKLIALLLIVIVCFISPVSEDYVVHDYLIRFVKNLDKVNSYSWGAAFLATLYCGIEKTKANVDGNCWPLLAFFCIRLPKLCKAFNFQINLEDGMAPLLNNCLSSMQKVTTNKKTQWKDVANQVLDNIEYEDII